MLKEIKLKNNQIILLDEEDFKLYGNVSWQLNSVGYARRTMCCKINKCGYKTVLMHRLIMKTEDPKVKIDHINGNKLDNRKENLRFCTLSQNQFNRNKKKNSRSKFKGIYFDKRPGYKHRPWCAEISINGKKIFLGYFKTEKEAAYTYRNKAKKVHKEFFKEIIK